MSDYCMDFSASVSQCFENGKHMHSFLLKLEYRKQTKSTELILAFRLTEDTFLDFQSHTLYLFHKLKEKGEIFL